MRFRLGFHLSYSKAAHALNFTPSLNTHSSRRQVSDLLFRSFLVVVGLIPFYSILTSKLLCCSSLHLYYLISTSWHTTPFLRILPRSRLLREQQEPRFLVEEKISRDGVETAGPEEESREEYLGHVDRVDRGEGYVEVEAGGKEECGRGAGSPA